LREIYAVRSPSRSSAPRKVVESGFWYRDLYRVFKETLDRGVSTRVSRLDGGRFSLTDAGCQFLIH
ncbi:MAG: hypothetical protein ACXWXL_11725, partial [Candidatus Binatia bacterium]